MTETLVLECIAVLQKRAGEQRFMARERELLEEIANYRRHVSAVTETIKKVFISFSATKSGSHLIRKHCKILLI